MGSLHRAFKEGVKKIPHLILMELVTEKLNGIGVTDMPDLAEALAEQISSGKEETFEWDDGDFSGLSEKDLKLEFTEEDAERLHK
jgi:hypothetical protein